MKKITLLLFCMLMPSVVFGVDVLASCGASKGHGYYFSDGWEEDWITDGRIILVQDGDNFDILYGTKYQSLTGYKEDGAEVIVLYRTDSLIRVGAFNEYYTDIFNFSLKDKTVAWSSNKAAIIASTPKTAVYVAECE